jgi:O-antigen/teichoic acid export membrane protein
MESANRVVKNTGFLYVKILITIFISLYSTRLILNALGEVNFGIFNLVGGVIGMLYFINGAMIIATQRYLSFYLGAGDIKKLKAVFSSSVILHLIIGSIVVILLEVAGLFLFNGSLNIPPDRIGTAKIVFHFMVVSTFFTINAVPFDASINSHENMLFDALLGILESLLKLGIAVCLLSTLYDKLILYGLLTAGLTIVIRIIKSIYCFRKYEECRTPIKSNINIPLLKEMILFAGWSLFGLFVYVLRNQGMAILLNLFYGVVVNAAYGIANQVNSNIGSFSSNMLRAINPQIVKSEGAGDRDRMLRLSVLACKMSFFLLAFFAIPFIIEMPFVLHIWLKNVPENTVIFCQLILLWGLMQLITTGLMTAITAVGDIKVYQIVVGAFQLLNLPLAYILIKLGLPAYFVFVSSIFLEFIAGGLKIHFAQKITGLNVKDFIINTLLKSFLTVSLVFLFALPARFLLQQSFFRAFLVGVITTLTLLIFCKYIALTSTEYNKIRELFLSFYHNFRTRIGIWNNNQPVNGLIDG